MLVVRNGSSMGFERGKEAENQGATLGWCCWWIEGSVARIFGRRHEWNSRSIKEVGYQLGTRIIFRPRVRSSPRRG